MKFDLIKSKKLENYLPKEKNLLLEKKEISFQLINEIPEKIAEKLPENDSEKSPKNKKTYHIKTYRKRKIIVIDNVIQLNQKLYRK